ncbi:MAG: DnaD domain protein [Eubacteriales bacterium]|nr:DnaD domain protein [Eubacteriales bacterium]
MGLVSFSRGYMTAGYTNISNIFMEEHLPYANGDCVRVYLYGLYLCQNSTSADNTIEMMSTKLGISVANIKDAFIYWEKQNLVQILDTVPMEVKYLPIKRNSAKVKELPKGKYDDFNTKAQAILDGRMITTTEFHEYYAFMESMHFEPEALLLVIKNCVLVKGFTVGYAYILTVAKNLAYEGLTTHAAVSAKFAVDQQDQTALTNLIKQIRKNKPTKEFIRHSYSAEALKQEETDVSEF